MLVIINNGGDISLKARFIVQLFGLTPNTRFFYLLRKEDRFKEKWTDNQVELATSPLGILIYFFLMILKSPNDIRDGMLRRLFHRKGDFVLFKGGFLSVLSEVLNQYFGMSARTEGVIHFLRKENSPKTFLVDEFSSLNMVKLKLLKSLGPIIYVSQDVAYDRYNFGNNIITKTLLYKLERDAVTLSDIVIACSERDRLKYVEMGAKKVISYPNIYPIAEFEPYEKDHDPSISIVLKGHWGARAERSLAEIFKALSFIDRKIRVYMIGIEPTLLSDNIILQQYHSIPSRFDYLNILSKSWIGINVGIHMGGANERKYDYAMAGQVVFSDNLGVRGDLLPHEYSYVDSYDLAAKLEQLMDCGKDKIVEMGRQNRRYVLSFTEKQREKLLRTLNF